MADDDDTNVDGKPKKKASAFKRLFAFARGQEQDEAGEPAQDWVGATDDMDVNLDDMLSGDAADMPEHLHLISLKALREALGEFEWQRRDERIRMLSEGLIRKRLPERATYRRFGEDAFVLVFPNYPPEQAGALTLTIADDMGYRLIGEQFHGSKEVRIGVAKADTQLMVAGGELDAGAMDIALKTVVPVETDFSEDRPDLDDDELDLPMNDVIDDREDEDPSMNLGDLGDGPSGPSKEEPDWARMAKNRRALGDAEMVVGKKSKKVDPGPEWVADEVEKREPANEGNWVAMGAAASVAPIAFGLPEDLFAVAYPAWSQSSGKIDLHVLAPAVQRDGVLAIGDAVLGKNPSLQAITVADRLMVEAGARMLRGAQRAPGAIVVPIHWETMNEARFPSMNTAFGRIDDTVRKSRLVMELIEIPEGAPTDRIKAAVQRLKTVSQSVLVRGSLNMRRHSQFKNAGATAVGIDLDDERMFHDGLPMPLADEMMAHESVPGYLWGIRRKADLLAAVEANFRFVAGPALKKAPRYPIKAINMPHEKMIAALGKFTREPGSDGENMRSK